MITKHYGSYPFFPPACISDANNTIQNLTACWLRILPTASIILVFTRQKLQTMLGSQTRANARHNSKSTTTKLKPEFNKSGDISFYSDYQREDGVIKGWQHWERLRHGQGSKRFIFNASFILGHINLHLFLFYFEYYKALYSMKPEAVWQHLTKTGWMNVKIKHKWIPARKGFL